MCNITKRQSRLILPFCSCDGLAALVVLSISAICAFVLIVTAFAFFRLGSIALIGGIGVALNYASTLAEADEITSCGYYYETFGVKVGDIARELFTDEYALHRMDNDAESQPAWVSIYIVDDSTYDNYLKELKLTRNDIPGKYLATATASYYDYDEMRHVSYDILRDMSGADFPISQTPQWCEELQDVRSDGFEIKTFSLKFVDKLPDEFGLRFVLGFDMILPYSQVDDVAYLFESELDGGNRVVRGIVLNTDNASTSSERIREILDGDNVTFGGGVVSSNYFQLTEPDSMYHVRNIAEQLEQNRRMLMVVNLFTYGFVILTALITTAINTISTSVSLQRREFAMLKSAGMTSGGLNNDDGCCFC